MCFLHTCENTNKIYFCEMEKVFFINYLPSDFDICYHYINFENKMMIWLAPKANLFESS